MIKRNPEEWQRLFEAHHASGLSASAFCKEHGLCPKYFSLRRRQLNDESLKTKTTSQPFVQAKARPLINNESSHGIVLRGRFGDLTFPDSLSPLWLATFIKSLG